MLNNSCEPCYPDYYELPPLQHARYNGNVKFRVGRLDDTLEDWTFQVKNGELQGVNDSARNQQLRDRPATNRDLPMRIRERDRIITKRDIWDQLVSERPTNLLNTNQKDWPWRPLHEQGPIGSGTGGFQTGD